MNKVKFAVFTDLHYDHIPDGRGRLEGLYTIVTLTEKGGIEIQGMNGHYQNISPEELGISGMWNGRPISPVVSSLNLD